MMTGTAILSPHKGRVEKFFASLDIRSVATRCPRNCAALLDQLALRAALGSRRTYQRDRRALRAMTAAILRAGQAARQAERIACPGDCLPVTLVVPGWFLVQPLKVLARLDKMLASSRYTVIAMQGAELVQALQDQAGEHAAVQDPATYVALMAGLPASKFTTRCPPTIKQAWEPIPRSCLEAVLESLPPGEEEAGLLSLIQSGVASSGLVRLLARSAWLTGMRSREMFGCRLFWMQADGLETALPDRTRLREFPTISRTDPARSIGNIRRTITTGQADQIAVLAIRTAKTRCASGTIDNRLRWQGLKDIEPDDLLCLWMTAQLRSLMITRRRMISLRDYCSRKLAQASEAVLPDRVHRITLHLLRHDFIDTCRRILPIHAVAVLAGHTAVGSARHYGGKYARYSRHRAATRWMPQPDPEAVRQVRATWTRNPEPGPATLMPSLASDFP